MRSICSLRTALLVSALGLVGCGKSTTEAKPHANPPPATTSVQPLAEVAKVTPPTTAAAAQELPELPRGGPSFVPGANAMVSPPMPIAQAAPAPQPVPAPSSAPIPAPIPQPPTPDPTPAPTQLPGATAEAKTPKPIEFPKQIDGRDINAWLREIAYNNLIAAQPDPQSREIAIKVLPSFGPTARRPALKPLIAVVDYDSDPGVRQAAITVISNMGYEEDTKDKGTLMAKAAVGSIQSRLAKTAPGSAERLTCVRSLASFGSDAATSAKSLRDICRDPSYETRIAIANALGRIGMAPDDTAEANKEAAMALLDFMIVDSCASVRMETIQALLILGPPKGKTPTDYLELIKPYLKGINGRIKPDVGKAGEKDKNVLCWLLLLQIMYDGSHMDANVKQLAQFVKSPDGTNAANLRMNAINALAVLGPKAIAALDVIVDALDYEDPYLVAAAISCLAPMGTAAVRSVPKLESIAKGSKDPPKPKDAPKEWKQDTSMSDLAKAAIEYVKGNKKVGVPEPKEAPKR